VRYTPPEGNQSQLLTATVQNRANPHEVSADFRFAAAVAAFGMLLRDSEHKGDATYAQILEQARGAQGADLRGYRAEFVDLVGIAARLSQR
jgi:Ca-activated chloride channel family protein